MQSRDRINEMITHLEVSGRNRLHLHKYQFREINILKCTDRISRNEYFLYKGLMRFTRTLLGTSATSVFLKIYCDLKGRVNRDRERAPPSGCWFTP